MLQEEVKRHVGQHAIVTIRLKRKQLAMFDCMIEIVSRRQAKLVMKHHTNKSGYIWIPAQRIITIKEIKGFLGEKRGKNYD